MKDLTPLLLSGFGTFGICAFYFHFVVVAHGHDRVPAYDFFGFGRIRDLAVGVGLDAGIIDAEPDSYQCIFLMAAIEESSMAFAIFDIIATNCCKF
jgi:hypothetical protein